MGDLPVCVFSLPKAFGRGSLPKVAKDPVIEALRASLANDPGNQAVRAHLAQLLLDAGHAHEALGEAATVLAVHPDDSAMLRLAARAALTAGDEGKAAAYQRLSDAIDATTTVPDTADEILDGWAETLALAPELGTLSPAGVTLADVGGLGQVKKRLEASFLGQARDPELRTQFGTSLRGGLLLWGPPGCGKGFVARALAGELGASFYEVGVSDVLGRYVGSGVRNLRSIFDTARRHRPCVVFFDEIDALMRECSQLRPGGDLHGVVDQMLAELDAAATDGEGVVVVAASDRPWDIDALLLRPGRFDRTVLVPPPDASARAAILATHLAGRPVEVLDLAGLAAGTGGCSGADLAVACDQAAEAAMEASMCSGRLCPITQEQLVDAARTVRPSTGEWMQTAQKYAVYGNHDGAYDELTTYLEQGER